MPIIKSAIKNLRKTKKRTLRNRMIKDRVHDAIKNFKKLVTGGGKAKPADELSKVYAVIDKATKKNILHKNTAARKKSAAAKLIAKAPEKAPAKAAK